MLRNVRIGKEREERKVSFVFRKRFTFEWLRRFFDGLPRADILERLFFGGARLIEEGWYPSFQLRDYSVLFFPVSDFRLFEFALELEVFQLSCKRAVGFCFLDVRGALFSFASGCGRRFHPISDVCVDVVEVALNLIQIFERFLLVCRRDRHYTPPHDETRLANLIARDGGEAGDVAVQLTNDEIETLVRRQVEFANAGRHHSRFSRFWR